MELKTTNARIAFLAMVNNAASYLEIGVCTGSTFFQVELPFKFAVDPAFLFNPAAYAVHNAHYFSVTSDAFFDALPSENSLQQLTGTPIAKDHLPFDIIFIDGLHTFEQSFRDFENSLKFSHDRSLWLLDDTIPCDAYSAIPDMEMSISKRSKAGLPGTPWHGDVFKTVLAIHDHYPEFSYCTLMDGSNPQTVVWRADKREAPPRFKSLEQIGQLSFYDMLDHAELFNPIGEDKLPALIGKPLIPSSGDRGAWRKLIYAPYFSHFSVRLSHWDRYLINHKQGRIDIIQKNMSKVLKNGEKAWARG